jgi:hypothetical protein
MIENKLREQIQNVLRLTLAFILDDALVLSCELVTCGCGDDLAGLRHNALTRQL